MVLLHNVIYSSISEEKTLSTSFTVFIEKMHYVLESYLPNKKKVITFYMLSKFSNYF